jgi:hypothetical protein
MQYKIEKGIPIPEISREREGLTALLRSMEIGDSFVCTRKDLRNVYAASKRIGIPIVTRRISEDKQRIWRVKDFVKSDRTVGEVEKRKPRVRREQAAVTPTVSKPLPGSPSPFSPDM